MNQDGYPFQDKERLFDLLIHDLRSPLAVVATSVHNLIHRGERYGPLTEKQNQVMERIARNVQKSQFLIQEMIEILRSEEGIFQREYFYLEPALREALMDALGVTLPQMHDRLLQAAHPREFQTLLESQGIFFQIDGKFCRSFFCHDQRKIQQILRNLISNALKYRRRTVRVQIAGETDLVIQVEDDGPGIPTEGQKTIFGRFVQLEPAPAFPLAGLGLGLAGVKTLVEAMGGENHFEESGGSGHGLYGYHPPSKPKKGVGNEYGFGPE